MHSREGFASLHGKEIQIVTQPCMARQVILAWQGNWGCCKALHGTASNLSRTKKLILDKILARAKCRPALHGKASIPCMARTLKVLQSLAWQGYIHSEDWKEKAVEAQFWKNSCLPWRSRFHNERQDNHQSSWGAFPEATSERQVPRKFPLTYKMLQLK